jgi:hypothetical protein
MPEIELRKETRKTELISRGCDQGTGVPGILSFKLFASIFTLRYVIVL